MAEVEQFTDPTGRCWVAVPAPDYVDGQRGQRLLEACLRLMENGVNHVAVNLELTRVVNSVGVSRLIELVEAFAKQPGASVAFCTSNPVISKTFRIMGLAQKASLLDSVETLRTAGPGPQEDA